MGTNRLVFQNWIVELGIDPENKEDLKDGLYGKDEVVSFEDLKDCVASNGAGILGDENEILRRARRQAYIGEQVALALRELTDDEREFVERFYYCGQSYREISEKSGRAVYKLEAVHKRAVRKLRRELTPLVKKLFKMNFEPDDSMSRATCPICSSSHRNEIDKLIADRDRRGTWGPVIKSLKEKFGLRIKTPQVLIGHEKYH
jgi:hypothetical protein